MIERRRAIPNPLGSKSITNLMRAYYDPLSRAYLTDPQFAPIREAECLIVHDGNRIGWDRVSLFVAMLKPSIHRSINLALARTLDAYQQASKAGDPNLLKENIFFIGYHPKYGLFPSPMVQKAGFVENVPTAIEYVDDEVISRPSDYQNVAGFHTHHPSTEVLKPSTCYEAPQGSGKYFGDLYLFIANRIENQKDEKAGRPYYFDPMFLEVIAQSQFEPDSVELLLLRESEKLARLDLSSYLELLRTNEDCFEGARMPAEVEAILENIGFKSCYLVIPGATYSYPIFTQDMYERVCNRII